MKRLFYISCFFFLFSCSSEQKPADKNNTCISYNLINDSTLTVATLNRQTSFYIWKGVEMGYEYEQAERFAKALGKKLSMVVAKDMYELVEMLENKKADIIAYPLYINSEFKERVLFTEHKYITSQVLIQSSSKKKKTVNDVTELIGKEVTVVNGSKYHERLQNLNNEIGGGIIIRTVSNEESEETLIKQVADGTIEFTVADDNVAKYNKTYNKNINISLAISYPQRSAWAVPLGHDSLLNVVNNWFSESKNSYFLHYLYDKHFEKEKRKNPKVPIYINKYKICEFDKSLKKNAALLGWDWRLLASMAYQESRFNPDAVSWAGAKGLMQLMPETARKLSKEDSLCADKPDDNITLAVRYLKKCERFFDDIDKKERIKFVLASYNAGPGHVLDAMALAEKHGKDPKKWDDNVEIFILLKNNPDYFEDPVAKHGYLRGRETYNYVKEILIRYNEYLEQVKE